MDKQQISYERDINSSYMKVPAYAKECLDVRILFHHKINGMITVERCYVNGEEQYWYDISGKQALDGFIKINSLEYSLFEMLILRICEQLEILEWNLLDGKGLILDPELIFLNHKGDDISFVFYPGNEEDILKEIQRLLEYLLSKLNHSNQESVEGAYELYEMSIQENCQIQDLKNAVIERRIKEKRNQKEKQGQDSYVIQRELINEMENADSLKIAETHTYGQQEIPVVNNKTLVQKKVEEKISGFYKRAKEILGRKQKEEIPTVIYPENNIEEAVLEIHPTVYIASTMQEPRGILIYEGMGDYPDFEIDKIICVIGKSHKARLRIERETVSNYHAKIDYLDGYYIEDMNSTNGTFVNDEIVNYKEKRLLCSGDVIRFADVKYRFL